MECSSSALNINSAIQDLSVIAKILSHLVLQTSHLRCVSLLRLLAREAFRICHWLLYRSSPVPVSRAALTAIRIGLIPQHDPIHSG